MIRDPAGRSGKLFQAPEARSSLPGVEHSAVRACNGINVLTCESRDTGKPLEEIQRHALTFQQCARTTADASNSMIGFNFIATFR